MNTASATQPLAIRSRLNLVLGAVLLVQLALVAYVYWPRPAAGGDEHPLLGDLAADDVTALSITDNTGRSVSLERTDDGWVLSGTDGYPAKTTDITELIDKLVAITSRRLVATTAASQSRLQVADDDYLRKLDLTTSDGVRTLYLGSSGGAAATHVRAAEDDVTYLTGEIATWELNPVASTWIDVAYFSVATADIQSVTLDNAHGTLTFVRDDDEEWTLADRGDGEEVLPANISTLVGRFAALNLHTVLGKSEKPEYGLAEPQATVTVTAKNPEGEEDTTTFVVGASETESNTYYFKSSASPYYVLLAAFTGDQFVEKQRSDFLAQPDATEEEPAAAPAPTDVNAAVATPEPAAAPISPLPTPAP